ncbi:MAG TPA: hypothetical protein QGH10_07120, partial [Armatimonadota bacterium]|nr:hypothetical protein [Armatimonadota bacterium]
LSLPGQGAHVLLTDPRGGSAGEALWALLARDFPTASREIAWERGDGIWAAGWAPGDIGDLASRYAKASWRAPFLAERANSLAAGAKDWADVEAAREVYIASRKHAALTATLDRYDLDALREGVSYLQREYADDYADAEGFLERASDLEERVHAFRKGDVDDQRLESDLQALQREALVDANPLIDFDEVLFVRRHTYQSNHYYTDYINGCKNFGGNICRLSLGSGEVTELAPELAEGIFGRLDLDFDGKRIVFDHKARIGEGFRVWEVGVDGEGLRQVTLPPSDEAERIRRYKINEEYQHHTDDMQPCYLPDGGICFISSRCEFGILCDSPDLFTTTVLHRVDRDGSNMLKLTNSSVSEATPTVMNDGRILYTRWEYVDKGAVSIKCLWAINPDGSGSYEVYGNDIALPPTMLHGRAIPGSDYLFSMLGTPHCPQSGVGTVIRLDISKDIRTREPMTYITPTVDIRAEGGFHNLVDGAWQQVQNGPLYGDPYPLSESFFLVAHNPDRPWNDTSAYGLYLIDEFGNRVLLHEDESISCWHPTPLRARPRPPLRASMLPEIAEAGDTATVVLQDVYDGLDGVARGAVKYIRVMEQVPRPWSARRYWDGDLYDQQHAVITKDTHLGLKVLHGVVPVEEDGSACITVPSDKNVFFQALDENHMELQRMRTYVNLRPGETRTCVGCHKRHDLAPPVGSTLALAKPPVVPGPQPGEVAPRPIYYAADVQPVWDRHCVACHNTDDPQGELDLSGAMT